MSCTLHTTLPDYSNDMITLNKTYLELQSSYETDISQSCQVHKQKRKFTQQHARL